MTPWSKQPWGIVPEFFRLGVVGTGRTEDWIVYILEVSRFYIYDIFCDLAGPPPKFNIDVENDGVSLYKNALLGVNLLESIYWNCCVIESLPGHVWQAIARRKLTNRCKSWHIYLKWRAMFHYKKGQQKTQACCLVTSNKQLWPQTWVSTADRFFFEGKDGKQTCRRYGGSTVHWGCSSYLMIFDHTWQTTNSWLMFVCSLVSGCTEVMMSSLIRFRAHILKVSSYITLGTMKVGRLSHLIWYHIFIICIYIYDWITFKVLCLLFDKTQYQLWT